MGFSFTINLSQKPKGDTRMLFLFLVVQRDIHVAPFGFSLRVILNEKLLILKKTTSSVLYVLLFIYANYMMF